MSGLCADLWAGLCWMVSKAYNLNAFTWLFKPRCSRFGEFSFIWNVNNSVLRLWLDWVMQLRSISFVHSSIYKIQLSVSNASKCWKACNVKSLLAARAKWLELVSNSLLLGEISFHLLNMHLKEVTWELLLFVKCFYSVLKYSTELDPKVWRFSWNFIAAFGVIFRDTLVRLLAAFPSQCCFHVITSWNACKQMFFGWCLYDLVCFPPDC